MLMMMKRRKTITAKVNRCGQVVAAGAAAQNVTRTPSTSSLAGTSGLCDNLSCSQPPHWKGGQRTAVVSGSSTVAAAVLTAIFLELL
jgi:hypothetical protein